MAGDASGFAPPTAQWLGTPPNKSVRLVFIGDISAVAGPVPPEIDETLRDILASGDLVVGNCESPVVARPHAPVATRLGTRHAMKGAYLDGALAAMGVAPDRLVLSLANNHMLDQGVEGFEETLHALAVRGINHIGTKHRPGAVLPIRGVQVGLLAFTQWRNAAAKTFDSLISTGAALAARDWEPLRTMNADIRCVIPHWDWEFRHFPRPETRLLAATIAAAGANLIAGHHAHVLQPVERVGAKTLTAYGLGDFLGTAFARQPLPARIGAIMVADISADSENAGEIFRYALIPFFRQSTVGGEQLVAVHDLPIPLQTIVFTRIARITGDGAPFPQSIRQPH
ncbi:CapA family protein [Mesorhizobium sp. NBSH29]|uniref:CapA family protein n=1 Tax=Mesorhizobium sp. NBSH29 TaxID=2654249 RepID=UPI001896833D|nr:CapA family protein [Mesorhizobium sp. NBSH29]